MLSREEIEKDQLVNRISNQSDRYGYLLIECMNENQVISIEELSIDMLKEFIEERGL